MMRTTSLLFFLMALAFSGCDQAPRKADCSSFFTPYPDMVSEQFRTEKNAKLVDGMGHYAKGEYVPAIELISAYLDRQPDDATARFFLANSLLADGRPFDAELELDRLERLKDKPFRDEIEWYNVMCLLCSDQPERALELARDLAARSRHTYKTEAMELVKALEQ